MLIFKVFLENDDEDVRQVRVYSNNVTNMKLSYMFLSLIKDRKQL